MKDYDQLIKQQLRLLDGLKTRKGQREKTIREIAKAEAGITSLSRAAVFKLPGIISERSFYDRDKDWNGSEKFKAVLSKVIDLYIERETAAAEAAAEKSRIERHERRVKELTAAHTVLDATLQNWLKKIEVAGGTFDDMTPRDFTQFMKVVFEQERAEHGETAVQKSQVDHTTQGGKLPTAASVVFYLPDNGRLAEPEGDE